MVVHNQRVATSLRMAAWIAVSRQGFRQLWARRHLTAQERANVFVSYSPPALITASLGGHIG